MKRLFSIILTALLLLCLVFPAAANEYAVIADMEELLTAEEVSTLFDAAMALKQEHGIHVMIVTAPSFLGNSAQNFADDFYDKNGDGEDGVLFLLSMGEREWYISTAGSMIYTLTDYGIQQIGEGAIAYISQGDYYGGFQYFLDSLPYYLEAFASGSPVDSHADFSGDYYHGDQEEVVYYEDSSPSLFLSLVIGLAAGGITVFIMHRMMDEKNKQRGAAAYIKDGSFRLNTRRDLFLYSNVSKTRKQQNTSSGGGSSVHRSSSGRSHGGGGGKF